MKFRALAESLKQDFKGAPCLDDGPLSAAQLGAACDGKSPEWVWAICRGEFAPSVADLLRWERECEGHAALDWLARQCGRMTIPVPSDEDPTLHEIADVLAASAKVIRAAADAYRDGEIDDAEAKLDALFAEDCDALVRATMALRARFHADARRTPRTMAEAERGKVRR